MPIFQRVLVVVGPPTEGSTVLDQAAALAGILAPESMQVVQILDGQPRTADEEDQARAALKECLPGPLSALVADGRADVGIAHGDPLEAILAVTVAGHVDVVVIGAEAAGRGRRALARRVTMKAPCSVWTAPDGATLDLERVLIAVDFSQRSADVLDVGTALAAAAGAERCRALHVRFDTSVTRPDDFEEATLGREQDGFALFSSRVNFHGTDVEPLFEEGPDVAKAILRVADDVDAGLVVMGTRGRTRASALLLGSEAEHVLMHSHRPVLAVKHFGSRLRLVEALMDPRFRRRSGARFG